VVNVGIWIAFEPVGPADEDFRIGFRPMGLGHLPQPGHHEIILVVENVWSERILLPVMLESGLVVYRVDLVKLAWDAWKSVDQLYLCYNGSMLLNPCCLLSHLH
jgi:hypothetical protein